MTILYILGIRTGTLSVYLVIHTLDIMYNAAAGNADTSCSP